MKKKKGSRSLDHIARTFSLFAPPKNVLHQPPLRLTNKAFKQIMYIFYSPKVLYFQVIIFKQSKFKMDLNIPCSFLLTYFAKMPLQIFYTT